MNSCSYRADIDGLRAVAVLSVVLYHFGIGELRGGFVGVDVFFVISGYLITGIVYSELVRGNFSLAQFYVRRARRIFPALFVVLILTMIAGSHVLLPSDLARLGLSSAATVLFVSNLQYFRESGYFDASSEFNPLLHTWSLGVEEQFYFALPVLLMLAWRSIPHGVRSALTVCTVISFVACLMVQAFSAKAAFFLSPFRAWELLLGSMLGIGVFPKVSSKSLREGIAGLALLGLLGAITFVQSGVDFPGWKAAIPAFTTAILLHVGASGGSLVSAMLSWKPLTFVGVVSYSLYLWHWPLLVMEKHRNAMEPLPMGRSVGLLALTFLLAIASYYWIEQPFRKHGRVQSGASSGGKVFVVSGAVASLIIIAGILLNKSGGLPERVPAQVAALDRARMPDIPFQACDKKYPGSDLEGCVIGAEKPSVHALVWGDSHALAWLPGLDELMQANDERGTLAIMSECAPLLGVINPKNPQCANFNDGVLEWIREGKVERVYLIAAWLAWSAPTGGYDLIDSNGLKGNSEIFAASYKRTIEALIPHVREIVVIAPTPGAVKFLPYRMAMATWQGTSLPDPIKKTAYEAQAQYFWKGVDGVTSGVRLVNPAPWFCGSLTCQYAASGQVLYRDGHHLNVEGARFVARHLLVAQERETLGDTKVVN